MAQINTEASLDDSISEKTSQCGQKTVGMQHYFKPMVSQPTSFQEVVCDIQMNPTAIIFVNTNV